MKKIIFAFAIAFTAVLTVGTQHSFAQDASPSITQEDTKASLEISKNIIKLIGALAKDFSTVKGDLITKTTDGMSVYGVTGMESMLADDQNIAIKSGGAAYYIATYKSDGNDQKKLTMSFAAFTGGVITITNADGNFTVEQDKAKSTGDQLVYTLSIKGTKVGQYTMDTKAHEGTLIIGLM